MKLAYWLFGLLLLSSAAGATETAVMCTNCSTAADFGTMAILAWVVTDIQTGATTWSAETT